jgi:hypothetical protein
VEEVVAGVVVVVCAGAGVEVEVEVEVEVDVEVEVAVTAGALKANMVKWETEAETSLLVVSTVDTRVCHVEPVQ